MGLLKTSHVSHVPRVSRPFGFCPDKVAAADPVLQEQRRASLRSGKQCEALLVANSERLYRFILKNTGNSSYARDLLQQTMMEAIKGYANFRGESAPSTWLFGIARNIIRNYIYRSPNRRYDFVGDESLVETPSSDDGPEESMEWKERIARIEYAIKRLPEKLRTVLVMVALRERSYKSVGRALGISVGTVRSRLSRARAQLRRKLEDNKLAGSALLPGDGESGLYAWLKQEVETEGASGGERENAGGRGVSRSLSRHRHGLAPAAA